MGETVPQSSVPELAIMSDFDALKDLLGRANNYSREISGKLAWTQVDYVINSIREHLEAGEVYVIRDHNGTPSSSITLSESDEEWGENGADGKALYFATFMKDPKAAEVDEAEKLLRFTTEEAERRNKALIRCDAVLDQPGIIRYYTYLGFEEKGRIVYQPSGRAGVLLEVPIARLQRAISRCQY